MFKTKNKCCNRLKQYFLNSILKIWEPYISNPCGNNEMDRMWNKTVATKTLSEHLAAETKEDHENLNGDSCLQDDA
jgi:hypothetical protein